jgi:RimJ/RimL family protein N-acetyltransferase
MDSLRRIAALLPDLPRWVEARSYLMGGGCEVLGLREAPALSLVIRDPDTDLLMAVGAPDPGALQAAAGRCGPGASLIAAPEDGDAVAAALPAWRRTRALLHRLADPSRLPDTPQGGVRFLDPAEVAGLRVEDELGRELRMAAEESPIAAVVVAGEPVSFCYAGAVTETLWDISIDTVPAHRRRGYAGLCVAFMIRHMHARGRQPVWGAAEDNPASWRLARKLGFEPVDELALFEPPGRVHDDAGGGRSVDPQPVFP